MLPVVDLQRVIFQSAAGKELQARMERFEAEVRSEIQSKIETAQAISKQAAELGSTLSFDQRSALQQQYEDAQIDIRRFQDNKQREGRKLEAEGLKQIEKQLQPVFEKFRDELGYDLILNNVAGVVLMARGKVDITEQVIEKLNSMNAGGE